MTDKEKIIELYNFVCKRENFFYERLIKNEFNSMGYYQCFFSAGAFQQIRYYIEVLFNDEEVL